jgi:hypothetical protein
MVQYSVRIQNYLMEPLATGAEVGLVLSNYCLLSSIDALLL